MALWQFAFNPIPATQTSIGGINVIYLSRNVVNNVDLGLAPGEQPAFFSALAALLPEKESWSDSLRIWGDEKADDIQVFIDGPTIECVQFRLDAENLSIALVGKICALARRFGWVFVGRDGAVIQPTRDALVRAVSQSPANKFVSDPMRYLYQASRNDIEPA